MGEVVWEGGFDGVSEGCSALSELIWRSSTTRWRRFKFGSELEKDALTVSSLSTASNKVSLK